jgi:ABC-type Mn2+/Zn2+ transport system ATPase subunit
LENFVLPISGRSSTLLIGKNGAGKTTVSYALEVLQKIARGTNQVADLVKPKDFTRGHTSVPMRFEIEVDLQGTIYGYEIAFEFPKGFKELRVFDEKLSVDGNPVYTREADRVHLARRGQEKEANFFINWHLVALPIVQESKEDSLSIFKQWLARALILSPLPSLIDGESQEETLQPDRQVTKYAEWFSGILAHAPSAYSIIDRYLKPLMTDLKDIKNPLVGTESRSLTVQFSNDEGSLSLPFKELSDGEKCFMICALVLAANESYGPLLCFWDEPDNHLALSEVGHFIMALRGAFKSGGQFITTSHNPEAIRSFSDENTLVLHRKSHLEPTIVQPLSEIRVGGDLIDALIRDDLEL